MGVDLETQPLQERFQHLLSVISGDRFLQKQGLGNEVPFFICPYRPEESVEMERIRQATYEEPQPSWYPRAGN